MRRGLVVISLVSLAASSFATPALGATDAAPPVVAAQSAAALPAAALPAAAPATTKVSGRSACAGSVPSVVTNLYGSAADQVEAAQAKYQDIAGFRAVVFDGQRPVVVVAPETLDTWRARLAPSGVGVAPSCVSSSLAATTTRAVDGTDVGPAGFSSVGYNGLTDTMDVTTTAPTPDLAVTIAGASTTAMTATGSSDGLVRISAAKPGDFGNASRGEDTAPFWGGARIWTDIGGCTTGFYLNSSTYGTVMLTAGHCYGVNGKTTLNGNRTATVGTSEGVHAFDPDLALIDGAAYYRRSYSWNDQTSSKLISEASVPALGIVYCLMGDTSLRICSAYTSLDVDANVGGQITHHLAYTQGPAGPGGSLGSAGDSGGGVFREWSDGTLGARGMAKATGCTSSICSRWDQKEQTITSFYSATVVTSG